MKRNIIVGETVYSLRQHPTMFCSGLIRAGEIVVGTHKTSHDPDETLFHEMIHACELELIRTRQITHVFSEEYVEAMGVLLYAALIRNGWVKMEVEWDQLELDFPPPMPDR